MYSLIYSAKDFLKNAEDQSLQTYTNLREKIARGIWGLYQKAGFTDQFFQGKYMEYALQIVDLSSDASDQKSIRTTIVQDLIRAIILGNPTKDVATKQMQNVMRFAVHSILHSHPDWPLTEAEIAEIDSLESSILAALEGLGQSEAK